MDPASLEIGGMSWLGSMSWLVWPLAGLIGAVVGRVLHIVAIRLPANMIHDAEIADAMYERALAHRSGETLADADAVEELAGSKPDRVLVPFSHCVFCDQDIGLSQGLPLIGLFTADDACPECGAVADWRRPTVEIGAMLVPVIAILVAGLTFKAAAITLFAWVCLVIAVIDAEHFLIPDILVFPLGLAGIAVNAADLFVPLWSSLAGAALGYGGFWALQRLAGALTQKDAVGTGDLNMLGAIGAWVGVELLVGTVLASSAIGTLAGASIMASRTRPDEVFLPYGTFMAVGGVGMLVAGERIIDGYWAFMARLFS